MPHITIETNLQVGDLRPTALAMHHLLSEALSTDIQNCKTRIIRHQECLIGTGQEEEGIVHVTIAVLKGRTQEVLYRCSQDVLELLLRKMPLMLKRTQVSVEIKELSDTYLKRAIQLHVQPWSQEHAQKLFEAFDRTDVAKTRSTFQQYWQEEIAGLRKVWVALLDERIAGYVTLCGDEIKDLNVVPSHRRLGVASRLMDTVEDYICRQGGTIAKLGVGLYSGYENAHRLYLKRGYVPMDGVLAYGDRVLGYGDEVRLDDGLELRLVKKLAAA